MAQTKNKKKSPAAAASRKPAGTKNTEPINKRKTYRREIAAIICLLLGIFSMIGYFSTNGWFIGNFCNLLKGLVGWGFYAIPPLLIACSVILCFHRGKPVRFRILCTLLLSVAIGALTHLYFIKLVDPLTLKRLGELWVSGVALGSGGIVSGTLTELFTYLFSKVGAYIVIICAVIFLLLVSLNQTIAGIVDAYKSRPRYEPEIEPPYEPEPYKNQPDSVKPKSRAIDIPLDEPKVRGVPDPLTVKKHAPFFNASPRVKTPAELINAERGDMPLQGDNPPSETADTQQKDLPLDIPFVERKTGKNGDKPQAEKKSEITPNDTLKAAPIKSEPEKNKSTYSYPTIDLLAVGTPAGRVDGSEEVRLNIERLEAAFRSFGVNVKISSYTRGPTVTRYEAELEAGVKLTRLTSLADDIALSLGASGVRIAAMPNKISTVGIEVPNKLVSKVHLRDIIDSPEFKNAPSRLTFAIGKNIGGEAIVGDIAKLTHMLVAGTTGSGKSVCLNSLILSILYKATPEEVRFIMIDPKMVEFRVYSGIPHLLVPVVTDVKKAAGALQWAVVEMTKRYRMLSEANVRDLESYNRVMLNSEDGVTLPKIVIVIDELADLMLTAAKEVEESVCRVAQMGRAAGIHLVIATQSPRADVITGLMKANIPSRISLKVSSALESRIILDAGGNADKLVGNGDMLYAPIGSSKPTRIQGTWVSDEEREKVVDFIKKSGDAQYNEEVIHHIEKAAEYKADAKGDNDTNESSEYDELLPQAVEVIFESGQASVSMLQRRLKLGYSRAARIVDQMEQLKIVGPFEGSKPRQLLITRDQWREMQFIQGTAPIGTDIPDEYFAPEKEEPPKE
jgi:DNA segregation ATPase FtsK/SpoIIIE, S-DNA-T family